MNALTVGFAHAFGPTVRVNCIMAGPFFTDVTDAWDIQAFEKAAQASHALQRGGQPDEIVGAALVLRLRRQQLHHRRRPPGRRRHPLTDHADFWFDPPAPGPG